jgi:hypothetical protein
LIPLIWNIYEDKRIAPLIELNASDWKSFFPENPYTHCNPSEVNEADCIAHPENPAIWSSKINRLSKLYFEKLRATISEFWIGIIINEDVLKNARINFANYLIIQQIEGAYDVWIDGSLISRGSFKNNDYPLVFPISMARLQGKPLFLAIHVRNNSYNRNIDLPRVSLAAWQFSI